MMHLLLTFNKYLAVQRNNERKASTERSMYLSQGSQNAIRPSDASSIYFLCPLGLFSTSWDLFEFTNKAPILTSFM